MPTGAPRFAEKGPGTGPDGGDTVERPASLVQLDPSTVPVQNQVLLDWCLVPSTPNMLINKATQMCMTVEHGYDQPLTQERCNFNVASELWNLTRASYDGVAVYRMTNPVAGLCVDVYHDSHRSGEHVIGYDKNTGLNQWMYQDDL